MSHIWSSTSAVLRPGIVTNFEAWFMQESFQVTAGGFRARSKAIKRISWPFSQPFALPRLRLFINQWQSRFWGLAPRVKDNGKASFQTKKWREQFYVTTARREKSPSNDARRNMQLEKAQREEWRKGTTANYEQPTWERHRAPHAGRGLARGAKRPTMKQNSVQGGVGDLKCPIFCRKNYCLSQKYYWFLYLEVPWLKTVGKMCLRKKFIVCDQKFGLKCIAFADNSSKKDRKRKMWLSCPPLSLGNASFDVRSLKK